MARLTDDDWKPTVEGAALMEKWHEYYKLSVRKDSSFNTEEVYLRAIALILLDLPDSKLREKEAQ